MWKFLSFCFCTLAILSGWFFGFGLGVVLWLIAWVFAGVTRHAASRDAVQNATLRAIQEQNELLRKQQPELLTNRQSVDEDKPFLGGVFSPSTHIMVKRHSKDGTSSWHEPLDFQQEVDGVPYILNSDSTVIAKTPIGVHTYGSWAAFRQATRTQRWR